MQPYSTQKALDIYGYWMRLMTFINYAGLIVCHNTIQNPTYGLPLDKKKLYTRLLLDCNTAKRNNAKWKLFSKQREILWPKSLETDVKKFDLTLSFLVIDKCIVLPNVDGIDLEKCFKDLQTLRNELCHTADAKMNDLEFENKWTLLEAVLTNLGFDVKTVASLKDGPLDSYSYYWPSVMEAQLILLSQRLETLEINQECSEGNP